MAPAITRRTALAALAAGCVLGAGRRAAALTLHDMVGREVTLGAPPRRIVCLVPSVTEMIFALGAESRLVGVTDFCDFPPAAREKPSVGGMISPSLETIVALRPDLVVGTDVGSPEETFVHLRRLGLAVYLAHANRLAEVWDLLGRVAELTERTAAVGPLVDRLQARVRAITTAIARRGRPRVLYVVWPEPLIVPGRDALVTELIELAGGDPVTARDAGAYPRLSLEAAVARNPEVILLAGHGGAGRTGHDASADGAARRRWADLASIPAIKTGRLHPVDGNLVHRYGPRVVDGLEQLARLIHPEAFR